MNLRSTTAKLFSLVTMGASAAAQSSSTGMHRQNKSVDPLTIFLYALGVIGTGASLFLIKWLCDCRVVHERLPTVLSPSRQPLELKKLLVDSKSPDDQQLYQFSDSQQFYQPPQVDSVAVEVTGGSIGALDTVSPVQAPRPARKN
jgi:hypothetical protein